MDEKGSYLIDEKGNIIKLENSQIDYLRKSNILEEE